MNLFENLFPLDISSQPYLIISLPDVKPIGLANSPIFGDKSAI